MNQPNNSTELLEYFRPGRIPSIIFWIDLGAILLGVLFNALLIVLLVKSRLTKHHPSGTFLGATSVNNILFLGFIFYWIYLDRTEYFRELFFNNFSCKVISFLWTFFSYNAYLLLIGFSVHMLLQQQLHENDDSTARKRGCCSLPRNPCWKRIATRKCSQSGTRVYLISASTSLVVFCLPIFWTHSTKYGICLEDWSIWGATWGMVLPNLSSIWWILFLITFPVITHLTICGSGAGLFTRSRNVPVPSTGGENQENNNQFVGLTRLSLITCTISWIIGIPVNARNVVLISNIDLLYCIYCIFLLCWPIFCCILVPGIFLEMRRFCASTSSAVRRLCCSKRQEERNEEEMASQT